MYGLDEVAEILGHEEPGGSVLIALAALLEQDRHLLQVDANERAITYRFAIYLQEQMPGWHIDCEYNRDGIEPKKLRHLELYPDSDDVEAKTVFPDVIAHHRGTHENYLVIEFKKSSSKVDTEIDYMKLRGYTRELGYQYALFIKVGTGENTGKFQIEWMQPSQEADQHA